MRPTRYAHFGGHTDICYSDNGRYIITCGSDGEVRIFEGLDDDDCQTHVVADCAHSIAYRDGRFLVGTDSNLVQSFTMKEGAPDGIITRFTAPATHIAVSKDGKQVACAGGDMDIKLHDAVAYKDKVLSGHQAPVLSVALDPKGEYLASSSCDGSVRVWDVKTSTVITSWNLVFQKTNNFSLSPTLCRLAWTPDGKFLVVPLEAKINVYTRYSWELSHVLEDKSVTEIVSVAAVSTCGRFIAGACKNGVITVWDAGNRQVVLSEKHPKSLAISGMVWNPSGKKELAFVDVDGQLGTIENIVDGEYTPAQSLISKKTHDIVENGLETADFPPLDVDMPDEDEDEYSISKIKSQLGFADDEEGTFVGLPEDSDLRGGERTIKEKDDDQSSIITSKPDIATPAVLKLPEAQKPFQPSMSPEHHSDRYMLWNNVGIVRQYSSDDENSIDVEFHDTSVHHALHLNNNLGHTMAALSTEALALACEAQDDQPSKLAVQHFSAWGTNKEWYVDMGEEEDILAVCLGQGWVAVATDRRNLRIFSTSGIQRDLLSIPGPVVCLAGSEDLLMVVFHSGMGISGDQHMAAFVLNVNGGRHPLPMSCPIPLSPRSFLAWAGFTDEGTPLIMDSNGIVRMLNRKFGCNWTSILNTKNHTRGKSDHYFLLGASETQGSVRSILCKGNRYPPVLPKPHVSVLDMQMPLCELETEKGGLEEKALRTGLLVNSLERLVHQGYDVDQSKNEAEKILKEAMIKLFALACRTERESRAYEVCQLMPSYHTVQLAIRYAGKLQRLQLADRLGEIASAKMEEEFKKSTGSQRYIDDDYQSYGGGMRRIRARSPEEEQTTHYSHHPQEEEEGEGEEEKDQLSDNPLLTAAIRRDGNTPKSSLLSSQSSKNPFKKEVTPKLGSQSAKKGIDVIDQFRKSQKKTDASPVLRPVMKKSQNKQATQKKITTQDMPEVTGKENVSENACESSPNPKATNPFKKQEISASAPVKKQSALQLWLADNENEVKAQYPDANEKELMAKAALLFKDLDNTIKQKYKTLASGTTSQPPVTAPTQDVASIKEKEQIVAPTQDVASIEEKEKEQIVEKTNQDSPVGEGKKRKVEEASQESPSEKKPKGSGVKKLAAFVFNKES